MLSGGARSRTTAHTGTQTTVPPSLQISAVVSQPASSRGRGRRSQDLIPTTVAQLAADRGLPPHRIFTHESARDVSPHLLPRTSNAYHAELTRISTCTCTFACRSSF